MTHSTDAIAKPTAKSSEAAQREIEETGATANCQQALTALTASTAEVAESGGTGESIDGGNSVTGGGQKNMDEVHKNKIQKVPTNKYHAPDIFSHTWTFLQMVIHLSLTNCNVSGVQHYG